MSTHWRIELLGGLRARCGERVLTRFATQKVGLLLAYLAYHLHRSAAASGTRRDALIDLLWPEVDPRAGRNSLSVALSSLRHQLEPPGSPAGAVLLADRASVRLNPDTVSTDVAAFAAGLDAAERAGSRTERATHLEAALALSRGELLPGYYDDWVVQERQWLAERYFAALASFLAQLEEAGDVTRALEYARQGVRTDPLREEAHQALIRLLAAAGQPEAARRQYAELERLLREELGTTPGEATRALVASLPEEARGPAGETPKKPAAPPRPVASLSPHHVTPSSLPTGTVTFLLTDIERSTARWESAGDAYPPALAIHHDVLRRLFLQHGGHEVKALGDGFLVAFERAGDALACAAAGQRALASQTWPADVGPLRVRMALHTGDVQPEDEDYQSLVLHCAARILVAGHGGQVLCSEATATLLRRSLEPGVRLKELGVYRLRDVQQPERLFQLETAETGRQEFPPLRAEAGYAGHLPPSLNRFFGREAEVEQLSKLLQAPEGRLVTLMGPGGSGKTRLALEVARRLVDVWQGAVWFVPLADLTDAGRLGEAMRDALRLPPAPQMEPLDQVVEFLGRQPSLLLLDNLEHLVEEAAPLVRTLLEKVPALTVLTTSRQRLNLVGEREFVVAPLPTPGGTEPPERLIQCESVQLFVDRAQAVRPDFQVTARNAAAVAALCQELEGIPLAIELAAARAQVLTPAQMRAQLQRRFELLVSRQRDLAERHRTLRGAIDWSYRLLSSELLRFFAGLSVFRGGWDLGAAEAVCEEPLALDYLAQLRECSLVLAEEGGEEIRFRMLESLREFAHEQLTPEEQAELERRHVAHFLALVEQAGPELWGPRQAEWLERLEREHENLRAALDRSLHRHDAEACLRLGAALGRFWLIRGYLGEGRERLGRIMAAAGGSGEPSIRATVLNHAGALAFRQGECEAARGYYEESLAIRRGLGDRPGIAGSLNNLGLVAQDQGDYEASRSFHEESLAIMRELENREGISRSLINLGMLVHVMGEYTLARSLLQEALEIQRQLGHRQAIAFALNNLANVVLEQGEHALAGRLHEESLEIKRELGDQWGIASSLHNLGFVALDQGDLETAWSRLEAGLAIRQDLGDRRGIADSLYGMASAAAHREQHAVARSLYEQSLAIRRDLGDRKGVAAALNGLGNLASARGDHAEARSLHEESLTLRHELGDRRGILGSLEGMARVARGQEQSRRAATLFAAAQRLRTDLGAPLSSADHAEYEQITGELRAVLGEPAFALAWAEGEAMSLEDAVRVALEESESPTRGETPLPPRGGGKGE